jgi:hypothetical protein
MHPWRRRLALLTIGLASVSLNLEDRAIRTGNAVAVARAHATRRGRPRKFSRPAKAVTLTLPEDIIATLKTIDADISRAIVRTVEPLVQSAPRPSAEVTFFGNQAVIVVAPSRELRDRTGVDLLPLSDGRALMAFDDHLSVSQLELRLRDALADSTLLEPDRETFEALAQILRDTRQNGGASVQERSIIVLET